MKERVEAEEVLEIDLRRLLMAVLRKWWLIILAAVIGGLGVYLYSVQAIEPVYRASITVYVNNMPSGQQVEYVSSSNLQTAQKLVATYSNIIQSDTVLDAVISVAGLDYTTEEMREILTTEQVDETEMFQVYVTLPDPQEAARLANIVADEGLAAIERIVEGSSAKVVDYAKIPTKPYSPNYILNGELGALAGIVLAVMYAALRFFLDVRIKEEDDLLARFPFPVLGQIPSFDTPVSGRSKAYAAAYAADTTEE